MEDWDANRFQDQLNDEAKRVLDSSSPRTLSPVQLEQAEAILHRLSS